MLVVIDPGFFREVGLQDPNTKVRATAYARLRARLDDANRLLHTRSLVLGTPQVAWLDGVYRREVLPILAQEDRALLQAVDRMFRDHRRVGRTLAAVVPRGRMWGVEMMAGGPRSGTPWLPELQRVLAATVATAHQEQTSALFLCHRIEGRNVCDRSSGGVELVEVLRWRLTIANQGSPTTVLPCVSRERHLTVPWTRRMDERLPDEHGPGRHPYCPPPTWHNSKTVVHRTAYSKPCWEDAQGQSWARPSTGSGYHWDVFLTPANAEQIGLSQINVTQHGAPSGQGAAGDLHHVPANKRHALRSEHGWRCPR